MSERVLRPTIASPSLVCLGLSHQSAPVTLLDHINRNEPQTEAFLAKLAAEDSVREVLSLVTCNRIEFYLVADDPVAACEAVLHHLGRNLDGPELTAMHRASYAHHDGEAAEHLFRVAAGIDSLIIGEAQILGQIRKAFDRACELGTSGEILGALLHSAIGFGRRVRTETSIGRGNVSVASVACRMAIQKVQNLADKEILVLGAGETGQLAARHFAKENPGRIRVLNRTMEHAEALARQLGGEAVPLDHLQSAIASADIVVCAVGAPHFVLTQQGVAATMQERADRPLVLIDLSMPRNIEPEIAAIPGVTLLAMEDLREVARGNQSNRQAEIVRVERLVRKETRKYLKWAASSLQNQLADTLRRHVGTIHKRTLERHLANADPELRTQVELFTDSVLRAAFHNVTEYIRTLDADTEAGRRELETIRRVFGLESTAAAEATGDELAPEAGAALVHEEVLAG